MTVNERGWKARIEKPVAIAVEGKDCFYTLLSQIDGARDLQDVQLWDFKESGNDELGRWLSTFKTLAGFKERMRAVGVIRDAEDDAASMAQSIRSAFKNNGFPIPDRPMIVTPGTPAVGFLLMPHGENSGCLEHAILQAATPDLPMHCVEEYLECIENGNRNPNPNWRAKMRVHALIAAGKKPARTLSESIRGGVWDVEHAALRVMTEFIRELSRSAIDSD